MLQTWECGIRLCKELASLYEEEQFDYHKLAAILVSVVYRTSRGTTILPTLLYSRKFIPCSHLFVSIKYYLTGIKWCILVNIFHKCNAAHPASIACRVQYQYSGPMLIARSSV